MKKACCFRIYPGKNQEVELHRTFRRLYNDALAERRRQAEHFRNSEKKLAKEQVRLDKKKKGSKNRQNQRTKVAGVHRRIRNQRKDLSHKTSRHPVNSYDHIVFEKLQIQNMVRNRHLAKSIRATAWGSPLVPNLIVAEYKY